MTRRDRLRIWETDYGRSGGWDVELDGRVIALLDEPKFEDMFWDSYRVTAKADDAVLAQRVITEGFWKSEEELRLVYRSRATGFTVDRAFAARPHPFVSPQRVKMRGLYIAIDPPTDWDRRVVAARQSRRSRQMRH